MIIHVTSLIFMSYVVFMWKMLKAATNVTLLFQRNKFLDVTDDNEERPWNQSYVMCDVANIVQVTVTVTEVLRHILVDRGHIINQVSPFLVSVYRVKQKCFQFTPKSVRQ